MLGIVRNRQSLVSTTGFRRESGEGRGLVSADGLVSLASLADGGGGGHRCAGMTKRGSARLPGRGDAGQAELAERLLASDGSPGTCCARARRCSPARGGTGASKSGGETRRPTFPAGRARHLR